MNEKELVWEDALLHFSKWKDIKDYKQSKFFLQRINEGRGKLVIGL